MDEELVQGLNGSGGHVYGSNGRNCFGPGEAIGAMEHEPDVFELEERSTNDK